MGATAEMCKGAYTGRLLRINLSELRWETQEIDPGFARKHIGGRGFASKILYSEVGPEVDPLAPENKLIFAAGALTGTPVPAASRITVAAKSPLSGLYGDSHAGGFFGAYLKMAGFDAVIIEGRSEIPVYLYIKDGQVQIRDAVQLWGKDCYQTEEMIISELGSHDIQVACIGPAGEKLVRYAAIMNGEAAAARCGVGAVMGSKNLKAIVVRATGKIRIADQKRLLKAIDRYMDVIKSDSYCPPAATYGTPRFMFHRVKFGIHGAKNWRYGRFNWEPLHPDIFRNEHTTRALSCPMCLMRCRRDMFIREGPHQGTQAKVEWETIARSMTMGVNDPVGVIRIAKELNKYGIDVESFGDTVACAMECFEKGLLTTSDTDGLELNFGDIEVILALAEKTALRQGFGSMLAEGAYRMSSRIGKGAEKYAMHVKKVEMTAGDPRGMPVRAVSYATSTRGSDHLRSNPYVEEIISPEEALQWFGSKEAGDLAGLVGKGRMLKWSEDLVTIGDLLGTCKFAYYRSASMGFLKEKGIDLAAEFYNSCTGYELSGKDMLEAGERSFNVEKAYNTREGCTRKDDIIPDRFFSEGIIGGASDGAIVERDKFEKILDEYYDARSWDIANGVPTEKCLLRLGLDDIYLDLKKRGKID